jgi:signal recognition particle receptor subunit beta
MRSVKIVVTGPVRAGTTSLIRSLSEIAVLSTERRVSSPSRPNGEVAVAMDFGRVTIADDLVLYLFGTPGEERDSLVGGPFAEGMVGIVVMVDAVRPPSVEQAAEMIAFLEQHSEVPYVVAANRMHDRSNDAIEALRDDLDAPDDVPIVPCDAVMRESAKQVLTTLLRRILATMP